MFLDSKGEYMKLTADAVKQLAILRATIKAKQREEEELCNLLKDRMVEKNIDEFSPPDSPFKLVKLEYPRTEVDWKDVAEQAYKKMYGSKWSIRLERMVEEYGEKHIIALTIEPNEHYQDEKLKLVG